MCSRYYRFKDLKDLYLRFKIIEILSWLDPQYNIAPTDMAINMRAESFSEKPHFRPWLLNKRCLVIADGYMEWKRKEITKSKTENFPYRFDPVNHEPIGLAGICNEDGFVVITTEPNALNTEIHDRMPVILRREDEEAWLDPENKDFASLITKLAPYPVAALTKVAISKAASNSKNKQAEILRPLGI